MSWQQDPEAGVQDPEAGVHAFSIPCQLRPLGPSLRACPQVMTALEAWCQLPGWLLLPFTDGEQRLLQYPGKLWSVELPDAASISPLLSELYLPSVLGKLTSSLEWNLEYLY